MNIPIVSSDILTSTSYNDKIAFIPLACNFYKEIKERIKKKRNNNNDLFVKYFPTISIDR